MANVSRRWVLVLVLGTGCASQTGAFGPRGYEQSLVKYRVHYLDQATQRFLPEGWTLDNYAFDSTKSAWKEKQGAEYRARRLLDEDGDGTISSSERKDESIFDLRFVNSRDKAVIWLKAHPLAPSAAQRDLEIVLENYADGLTGAGLFEQSSLFGLANDRVRQFTTFIVKQEPTQLRTLPALRGVIEIADVERLRVDPAHRDSKAELVFAKISYLEPLGHSAPVNARWPTVRRRRKTEPGGRIVEDFQLLGPRLRIRRVRIGDAEASFRWFANPTVTEFLPLAGERILPMASVLDSWSRQAAMTLPPCPPRLSS